MCALRPSLALTLIALCFITHKNRIKCNSIERTSDRDSNKKYWYFSYRIAFIIFHSNHRIKINLATHKWPNKKFRKVFFLSFPDRVNWSEIGPFRVSSGVSRNGNYDWHKVRNRRAQKNKQTNQAIVPSNSRVEKTKKKTKQKCQILIKIEKDKNNNHVLFLSFELSLFMVWFGS